VLKLTSDARLVAAVAGAVGYFADQAGLDAGGRADLITAIEEACREIFPLLDTADSVLSVRIEGFPDRIEVVLEHQGQPVPAARLPHVDRVQYETQGSTSHMTLVKYVRNK
jgi:hypothetical protein